MRVYIFDCTECFKVTMSTNLNTVVSFVKEHEGHLIVMRSHDTSDGMQRDD